jgi:hypothetical protein
MMTKASWRDEGIKAPHSQTVHEQEKAAPRLFTITPGNLTSGQGSLWVLTFQETRTANDGE